MEQIKRISLPSREEPLIIWADLNFATFWDAARIPQTGEMRFEFRPSDSMRYNHQIQDGEYNNPENDTIIKSYPMELCILVNPSRKFTRWFIFTDYRGEKVELAEKINLMLLAKVKSLVNQVSAWKQAALTTSLRMKRLVSHTESYRREVIEQVKKDKDAFTVELGVPKSGN